LKRRSLQTVHLFNVVVVARQVIDNIHQDYVLPLSPLSEPSHLPVLEGDLQVVAVPVPDLNTTFRHLGKYIGSPTIWTEDGILEFGLAVNAGEENLAGGPARVGSHPTKCKISFESLVPPRIAKFGGIANLLLDQIAPHDPLKAFLEQLARNNLERIAALQMRLIY
jgi:hypothetical protein